MSNVEAGGATVFPTLNVALWPQKGSAAFWYNLHLNGEGNVNTRHAACPVLTGSKWGRQFLDTFFVSKTMANILFFAGSVKQMDSRTKSRISPPVWFAI